MLCARRSTETCGQRRRRFSSTLQGDMSSTTELNNWSHSLELQCW
jgi:hypothetical protein